MFLSISVILVFLMKKSILLTAIVALYVGSLCIFFFMDAADLGEIYMKAGVLNDNVLHFFTFFLLAFFMSMMLASYNVKHHLINALVFSIMIACIIEIVQYLVPTRHAMLLDFFLHTGGVAGYIVLEVLLRKIKEIIIRIRNDKEKSVFED